MTGVPLNFNNSIFCLLSSWIGFNYDQVNIGRKSHKNTGPMLNIESIRKVYNF